MIEGATLIFSILLSFITLRHFHKTRISFSPGAVVIYFLSPIYQLTLNTLSTTQHLISSAFLALLTPISLFKLFSTISTHPFRWFFAGKACQETGAAVKNKPLEILGKAITVPPAFIISHQYYNIPIASKGLQGFLLAVHPFELGASLIQNQTLNNQTYSALNKGLHWGLRSSAELFLDNTILPEYATLNKIIGLSVIEQNVTTTLKTLSREKLEKVIQAKWVFYCPELEAQTPFLLLNLLYPFTLEPISEMVAYKEYMFFERFRSHNTTAEAATGNLASPINSDINIYIETSDTNQVAGNTLKHLE